MCTYCTIHLSYVHHTVVVLIQNTPRGTNGMEWNDATLIDSDLIRSIHSSHARPRVSACVYIERDRFIIITRACVRACVDS
jgi:hypothetical protein